MKAEKSGLGGSKKQQEDGRGDEERYWGAMDENKVYYIYYILYICVYTYICTHTYIYTYDFVC